MGRFAGRCWGLGVLLCSAAARAERPALESPSDGEQAALAPKLRLDLNAQVQFRDRDGKHRAVYVRRRAGAALEPFEELCTTPCSESLPPGSYTFALSSEEGHWFESRAFELRPGMNEISTDRVDASGLRTAGVVSMLTGAVAVFVALSAEPSPREGTCQLNCTTSWVYPTSLGLVVLGFSAGIPLIAQRDRVTFSFYRPSSSEEVGALRSAPLVSRRERASLVPNGATLSVHF